MIEVTDDTFQVEVLNEAEIVLVDFSATWCAPCKAMLPVLEDLEKQYKEDHGHDGVKFVKADIDDCPLIARRYSVRSVPTLMIFLNGEVQGSAIGSQSRQEIINLINESI